jgi:hypothetical protein
VEHWADVRHRKSGTYFRDEAVRQEIRAAGERSVLHPDFDRGVGWVYAMSMFALGYAMVEDWTLAKECFTRLGPYGLEWGWHHLGEDAAAEFVLRRAMALERG